jgi:RNA polymerase sigma-70 factor (ECF subfamily)
MSVQDPAAVRPDDPAASLLEPTDGAGTTFGSSVNDADWLERFWTGERATMDEVCRNLMGVVNGSVGRYVQGADRETVVQTVFLHVLDHERVRRNFQGGSLRAWLSTVAKNQALDFLRVRKREIPKDPAEADRWAGAHGEDLHARAEARMVVKKFQRERLPAKWAPVFEARFLQRLTQRDAAQALGMRRTTLAYQELRIRALLKEFLTDGGSDD